MSGKAIDPRYVEDSLLAYLAGQVKCTQDGDSFLLDTPFVLQDGHQFQAVLEKTATGVLLSDGGFVRRQFEIFSRNPAMLRERTTEAELIARELALDWENEFCVTADSVDSALQRIATLVRAADRSLALLGQKPPRRDRDARSRLKSELKELGLRVHTRARPEVPGGLRPVVVDQLVQSEKQQAAVEILSARTESGAAASIDRSVTNFRVLEKFEFDGALFAVYDSSSPASSTEMIERFEAAAPRHALLLPERGASETIYARLAS
jgi:hypothetical protein